MHTGAHPLRSWEGVPSLSGDCFSARKVSMSIIKTLKVVAAVLLSFAVCAFGQSIFATLTGTVSDPSGAVVPNANVTMKNEGSGDIRKTVSNSDGYFTFSSLPTGTYTMTVEAPGFQKHEQAGLSFTGSEKR